MLNITKAFRFCQLTKAAVRFNSTVKEPAAEAPVESAESKQQTESELQTIQEYKQALKFFSERRYDLSEEYFNKVLTQVDVEKQYNNHLHVLKKLVSTHINRGKYQQAETLLDDILKLQINRTTNQAVLAREYNNLLIHCVKTNPNRAIKLGKALLHESRKADTPVFYQKAYALNLGTAYLMIGNYIDAKSRLRECITLKPNSLMRGSALNNLALACWWHKIGKFSLRNKEESAEQALAERKQEDKEYGYDLIEKDFQNTIPLFKNAISTLEEVDSLEFGEKKASYMSLLDQNTLIPPNFKEFESGVAKNPIEKPESGAPLSNISEFLFEAAPNKKIEARFWFKLGFKFFEEHDPENIKRSLIILALFTKSAGQYVRAEELFRKALQSFNNTETFNKMICMLWYGNMLKEMQGREKEGIALLQEARALQEKIPYWAERAIHASIPNLEL